MTSDRISLILLLSFAGKDTLHICNASNFCEPSLSRSIWGFLLIHRTVSVCIPCKLSCLIRTFPNNFLNALPKERKGIHTSYGSISCIHAFFLQFHKRVCGIKMIQGRFLWIFLCDIVPSLGIGGNCRRICSCKKYFREVPFILYLDSISP